MKFLLLSITICLFSLNSIFAQPEEASLSAFSIGDIEFSVTPKHIDKSFEVQFLFPRTQELEMYLSDMNGDLVSSLFEKQDVEQGVKTLKFEFPDSVSHGNYLLIIKSNNKSVIKKLEYLPKI